MMRQVARSDERDRPTGRGENDDAAKCRWLSSRRLSSGQETGDLVTASCRFQLVCNFLEVHGLSQKFLNF